MHNPGITPATAGTPDVKGLQTYRGSFRTDDLPATNPTLKEGLQHFPHLANLNIKIRRSRIV